MVLWKFWFTMLHCFSFTFHEIFFSTTVIRWVRIVLHLSLKSIKIRPEHINKLRLPYWLLHNSIYFILSFVLCSLLMCAFIKAILNNLILKGLYLLPSPRCSFLKRVLFIGLLMIKISLGTVFVLLGVKIACWLML